MRSALVLTSLLLACVAVVAQTDDATPGRRNQKIERLVHEDSGSRIEETRVGGQTENITVQPKAPVPTYEVQPPSMARRTAGDDRRSQPGAGGTRYWNVFKF